MENLISVKSDLSDWTFDDEPALVREIQMNAAKLVLEEMADYVADNPPTIEGTPNGPMLKMEYLPDNFCVWYPVGLIKLDTESIEPPHLVALKRILTEALEKVDAALNCHGVSADPLLSPAQD